MQAASDQVASITAESANEAATLRTSYAQQISDLQAEVALLQQGKAVAPAASSTTSAPQSLAPDAVLCSRVEQLEAANAALEQALLSARGPDRVVGKDAEESRVLLTQCRAALAEKDAQVGSLAAEVEILRKHSSLPQV